MKPGRSVDHLMSSRYALTGWVCLVALLFLTALSWADWPGVGENLPVCTATGEQYIPQIVPDGNDGCVIIWFDARGGMELINVYGQRVSAQGDTLWTPSGVQLTSVPSYTWISYLVACTDGSGGAFFAWEDPRNGNFDVYVQHVDSSGTSTWLDNGVQLASTGNDEYVMDISADGQGGCIVAWNNAGTTSSILAQRVDANGSKLWSTNGVEVSVGSNSATRAQLVSDGSSGIIACWLDGRYHPAWNEFKDIYAQKIDSTGSVCWADTSVVVLGLGSAPYYAFPELITNEAGRFFIAWYDWRASGFDIYAQCLNNEGQGLWVSNGASVCLNPLEQTGPRIAPGISDGLFCIWVDNYTSVRAQMLDAAGANQWSSTGVVLASNSNGFVLGSALRTSNNLYAAVYGEDQAGGMDRLVTAQALDESGNLVWNAAGEPVSTVVSPKSNIRAIADTCGGVIVSWTDERNGSYTSDIYAQRVDPAVFIDEIGVVNTAGLSLRCTPNLCRNSMRIVYTLQQAAEVDLNIYDAIGRRIANLHSGVQSAGQHVIAWNVTDAHGGALPAGVYLISLVISGAEQVVEKAILLE